MNIGILTFHTADNYGSVLQAYALKTFVEKIEGVDKCELINYLPPNQEELYAIYLPLKSLKNIIKNMRAFCFRGLLEDRKNAFNTFRKNRLCIDGIPGKFDKKEERCLKAYDIVIVGSDQIWNPRSVDFSMFYFVPEFSGKKIAYAPSFGNGTLLDFEKKGLIKETGDALQSFHSIAVREQTGISIIEQLSGKTAQIVVDPTLLILDEWENLAASCDEKEKYIFFYAIDYNPQAIKMVQQISRKTGLPVKVIFSSNKTYRILSTGFQLVKKTSPEYFLSLVKNAELILSSSFHGTAFSLIFKKKFYALEASRKGTLYKDQRIHSLLSRINLEDRIITIEDIDHKDFLAEIVYDSSQLTDIIEESKRYLIDAITN